MIAEHCRIFGPPLPPSPSLSQTKAKVTRKYAAVKRMIKPSDPRLKENIEKAAKKADEEKKKEEKRRM